MAAIVARTPGAREVDPKSARFEFVAHLEPSGTGGALARGYLSVKQQGQSPSVRDVAEAPCPEIVESMAVILSLIVAGNESASDTPVAPAAAVVVPAPPAPPAEPVPAPEVAVAPVAPAPPPAPPPAQQPEATPAEIPAEPEAAPPAPPERDSERLRFGVRLGALAETAVAPSIAFGGEGGLDVWWARSGWWSPSARLTARYVRSGLEEEESGAGSARFRLVALRAELCPLRWPTASSTFGRVCALFDAGELAVQPEEVAGEPQSQTMPWIGGGGSLRLESALADFLSLEAAADLVGLARTDRFTFEPGSQTLHQVPKVSAMFSLGAVLRLP